MSTMRADLLSNRLGTSHPAVTRADFVKAWAQINQTVATANLVVSFNVSSLSDTGVGAATLALTATFSGNNAMAGVAALGGQTVAGGGGMNNVPVVNFLTATAANTDSYPQVALFGALA